MWRLWLCWHPCVSLISRVRPHLDIPSVDSFNLSRRSRRKKIGIIAEGFFRESRIFLDRPTHPSSDSSTQPFAHCEPLANMAATLGRICKSGLLKPNYGTLIGQVSEQRESASSATSARIFHAKIHARNQDNSIVNVTRYWPEGSSRATRATRPVGCYVIA